MRVLLFACLAVASMAWSAGEGHPYISGGYQEAVFSVSDAAGYSAFLTEVGAWKELHRGELDRAVLAAWS